MGVSVPTRGTSVDELIAGADALIEEARSHTRRRRRRAAITLAAAAIGVVALAFADGRGGSPPGPPPQRAGDHGAIPARLRVAQTVRVPGYPLDLVAGHGSVWVAQPGAVTRVDEATGRILATISTPRVGEDAHIAAGLGAIWVTPGRAGGPVYRIDPDTDAVVARVQVPGSIVAVATGAGRVWVTRVLPGDGQLVPIDPASDRVSGAAIGVGPGPEQVAAGGGVLFVQDSSPASIVRVDPASRVARTVVGPDATSFGSFVVGSLAVDGGSLWAARNGLLARIDPANAIATREVSIPRAQFVAAAGRRLWVLTAPASRSPTLFYGIPHSASLVEIDARTGRVIARMARLSQQVALAAGSGGVWLAGRGRTVRHVVASGERPVATRAYASASARSSSAGGSRSQRRTVRRSAT